MTAINSESTREYRVITGNILSVNNTTNSGVNIMKFITFTTVSYIPATRPNKTWRREG